MPHPGGADRTRQSAKIRRERFAHEYLIDFDGTAAYCRVFPDAKATKGSTASTNAHKLLQHPDVQAIIQAVQKERLERIDITAEKVLQEWARIAFGDIRDIFDADGGMISPKRLSAKVGAAIESIEFTQRAGQGAVVTKVKRYDKNKALEMLAKHLGLLKDQPPPPQWNIDPATLATMSTEDLEKALQHAEIVQNFLSGKAAP